ncbi:AAA family ATPase [Myxococcota bacterium]
MTTATKLQDIPQLLSIAHHADVPVLLEGGHGIGKSSVLEQSATEMGIDVRVLDLSLMEPVDLLGLPAIKDGRTVYSHPAILPTEGKGLLLLEELNRAHPQVRTPALELLTRRRLHEYELPKGWLPCASINPASEGYAVDVLDPALVARFMLIRVVPSHDGWLEWARTSGIHSDIIEYVEATPDIFVDSNVDPRSLEYASNILRAFEDNGHSGSTDILATAWSGLVGEIMAVALLRFMKSVEKPPTSKEVIGNYSAQRPLVRRAVEQSRLDLVRTTLQRLKRTLQRQKSWDDVQASNKKFANLRAFLGDIPADLREDFDAWAVDRGYSWERSSA